MRKKFTKRLLSSFVALMMVLSLLPTAAFAAEGDVAQIGDTPYATLDQAIAAAADGATIELLADATTSGMNLSKDLTIRAADGVVDPTITFTQYGIALWGKALTFKNVNVVMNGIGSTPYTGEWNWQTICASSDASLTLDNVDMTMDATGTTNSPHAIYFCNNNVLNIVNGSNLTIKNYGNDALEWDGGNGGYNVNIIDSTFTSDHNRSGFTGTFYATITNSDVDVINSTGNGSNGSHFIITNSDVNFSNNGSHGLSAGELVIDHSTVTTNNNHGMGITVNNGFTVKNDSVVTVTGNADNSSYGYAAVRLYNNFDFSVDSTSELYINNNNNTGLYVRQGKLTVEDGAVLEIMGNKVTHNALDGYGGGIYVGYGDNYDPTVILPADVKIYNNHAITGGDDIYVSEGVSGPSLTFGAVGEDWVLDGDPDCEHVIDGWYDDSEGTRWEAHADTEEGNHIEEFTDFNVETGLATVTGLKALKAAHGADAQDKTSFPGLTKQVQEDSDMSWGDNATAEDGQKVNFMLTTNVPTDLKNYVNPEDAEDPSVVPIEPLANVALEDRGFYVVTIHDQMDEALVNPENFVVTLGGETLTLDEDYTIHYNTSDGCDFEITMDLVALYEAGIIDDTDIENATAIVVNYSATLAEGTTAGEYPNTSWVTYPEGESAKDTVTVETFQIYVFKYDQTTNEGLDGAEFKLEVWNVANSVYDVVDDTDVRPLVSNAEGYITIDGLDAGIYKLTETKAPDGYVNSKEPIIIHVEEDAGTSNVVRVQFANSPIPHTGGMGTTLFTVGGAAILAAAGALFVVTRKRENR